MNRKELTKTYFVMIFHKLKKTLLVSMIYMRIFNALRAEETLARRIVLAVLLPKITLL